MTFNRVRESSGPVGRACEFGIPLHEPCSVLSFRSFPSVIRTLLQAQ